MQYNFTNIELADSQNGQLYVKTTAVKAGDPGDRGFSLPFFNPEIIRQVQLCKQQGVPCEFSFNAEIEEQSVPLGAVYFRRATDANGRPTDQPALDKNNQRILYKKINVHTIFQYSMHDAFYVEGEKKGMRIMENVYENGVLVSKPAKAFDLDDLGRPIKQYMRGWSPEERRDSILATFFMIAPQEYQTQPVAPQAAPEPAPEQSLQGAVNNLFGPAPAPQAAPQPAPQQAAVQQPQANAVNPLT